MVHVGERTAIELWSSADVEILLVEPMAIHCVQLQALGGRGQTVCLPPHPLQEDLDAGEAFERMQLERIMATNPESAAYHAAMRKAGHAGPGALAGGGGAGTRGFGGVKAKGEAMRKREHELAIATGTARG